jgi:hypothetical protein
MESIRKLGDEIEDLWREENYDESVFPALAAAALRGADLPSRLADWDLVEWALDSGELPPQKDPQSRFGEPPITLYVGPRFHIDIYIWLEGTTAIHQHGFCGAFQVMMGSSIHSWYGFECSDAVNSFFQIGRMDLKQCELLERGAVQEIRPGSQYIHSLFHLDQLSMTLVVRTDKSALNLPQFSYHKPVLAVSPFFEHETTVKKLQLIAALFRARHPEIDRLVSKLLERSDLHTAFLILSTVHSWLRSDQLNQIFHVDGLKDRFAGFLEIASRRHGKRAEIFSAVFARIEIQNEIMRMRGVVSDPEHRFFLALLMNVDGRKLIFSLIKQRFPDRDPIEKILDWAFDLAETRVFGVNNSNALGIRDFDNFDLMILENILREKTADDIRTELASHYSSEDARGLIEKLAEREQRIREAVIFQPLFAPEPQTIAEARQG